jgi:hypothetical protein
MSETILEWSVPANIFITCFLVHSLQLQIPESHGDVVLYIVLEEHYLNCLR